VADQIVINRFHAIRKDRRATAADIQEIYLLYKAKALEDGLVPLGYSAFRMRAYQIPVPRRNLNFISNLPGVPNEQGTRSWPPRPTPSPR
jgi:hypothetical protein